MKALAIMGIAATAFIAGCSSSNQTAEAEMETMEPVVETAPAANNYEVVVDPKSGQRTVIDRTTGQVVQ